MLVMDTLKPPGHYTLCQGGRIQQDPNQSSEVFVAHGQSWHCEAWRLYAWCPENGNNLEPEITNCM